MRALVALLLFVALSAKLDAQTLNSDQLHLQASECMEMAERTVLDFYLPECLDSQGGYHENLDEHGKFMSGKKFLTLQARQLWMFSTFAERGIREEECLAAARHGFDYLQEKFFDAEHGGYFNELNADGSVFDSNKHAYLNSFALYGMVAYYRASGDEAALSASMSLFETLEVKAYDHTNGGYQEFFDQKWALITDRTQAGIVGAVGTKTYNTHLHLMESFADLYRATGDPRVANRLAELIIINTASVQHPTHVCNIDGWTVDWKLIESQANLRASYGHDVECAWLVLDACKALGWKETPMRKWATNLVDYSLRFGFDEKNGGFFYSGPVGEPATELKKEWWVQAEAMVGLLELYRLTKDEKYYTAFNSTFDFVKRYHVAEEGSWWATREADGTTHSNRSRTSKWQGGYHNGRALLRCADLLHQIADGN